jgi:hypothetical protein
MSEENVEVLRRVYKVADARGVEGLLEFATDDIVWISDPRFPGGGRHNGKENVRRWLTELWIYDEVSIDVEEIIDLDDRALGITPVPRSACGCPSGRLGVVPPHDVQRWTDQSDAKLSRPNRRARSCRAAGVPVPPRV